MDSVRDQSACIHKKYNEWDWKKTEKKQIIKEFFLSVANEICGFLCDHLGRHCRMPTWI